MATSLQDVADQIAAKNTITPTTQDFDESKGVAGRTNDLISQDSPLMQTAATQGTQLAAKRGLTNSSLGVQSAQQAVINTAVPIATSDASLYQQNSLAGLAAKNAASTANAQIGATLGGTAMQLGSQEKQQEAALGQQKEEFGVTSGQTQQQIDIAKAAAETQKAQFGVTSGQTQQQIDAQKSQFAQSLGLSVEQLDLNRASLTQQQQQFLASLDQQKAQLAQQASQFGVSSGQTQQQIDAQKAQFAQSLGLSVQELDLKVQQLGQAQQQIDAQKSQFAQQLGLSVQQLDLNRDQLTAQQQQFVQSLDQQKAQLAQQQSQFTSSLTANQSNFAAELGQKQTQFEASQLQAKVLAQADNDTRLALTKLQTDSQQDIQSNQNISGAWGTMMQNIANVQNNPNLDPAAKQTLIQNNIGAFQSFTNFWKKTSGPNMDVTDLLNFGVAAPAAPTPAPAIGMTGRDPIIPPYTGGGG